ncbi:MAG: hypothetical protein GDYSWBUE_000272 [Candidatus Fervidibacterota bacterium]
MNIFGQIFAPKILQISVLCSNKMQNVEQIRGWGD